MQHFRYQTSLQNDKRSSLRQVMLQRQQKYNPLLAVPNAELDFRKQRATLQQIFNIISQKDYGLASQSLLPKIYLTQQNNISKNTITHRFVKYQFGQATALRTDQLYSYLLQRVQKNIKLDKLHSTPFISHFIQIYHRENKGILVPSSPKPLFSTQKLHFLSRIMDIQLFLNQQDLQSHLAGSKQTFNPLNSLYKFQNRMSQSPIFFDLPKQNPKLRSILNGDSTFYKQSEMGGVFQKNVLNKCQQNWEQRQDNSQGAFTQHQIQIETQPFLLIKQVNKQLRKSNLLILKLHWNQRLESFLKETIKNQEVFQYESYQSLFCFLKLNQYKMLNLRCEFNGRSYSLAYNLYERIYPGITFVLNSLLQKLQVKSLVQQRQIFHEKIRSNAELSSLNLLKEDEKNRIFFQELRTTYNIQKQNPVQAAFLYQYSRYLYLLKNSNISTKDNTVQRSFQTELHLYLQQTQQLFQNKIKVQEISTLIHAFLNEHLKKPIFDDYFNQIQLQRVNQSKCLGCCQSFFVDKCIYDETISEIPLKNFPTIHKLKDYEVDFKDTICAMLNNGGGIIMFDCYQIHNKLYARGENLTEKDKEQIQQRVTSYFRWFYPRPEINLNIKITFVPIMDNSAKRQEAFRQEQKFSSPQKMCNFLQGMYVTRLRIAPSDGINVYFWFHSKKQSRKQDKQDISLKYCNILDQGNKPKLLNFGQMRRLIKKKFSKWYIPLEKKHISQLLMQKSANIFGHQCYQPEKGQQVTKKQEKLELKVVSQQPGKQKIKHHEITIRNQSKFAQMVLLIAKKDDLGRIKSKLQENKIECQLQIRFTEHNFKPANNTAILYHQSTFETVHKLIVEDPRFRFSTGKPCMAVNITKYIRFELRNQRNKLDNQSILKYKTWLKQEFSEDTISFYEYQVDHKKRQFYLSTSSRLSLLFLYFKITHHGDKVSFKNPFNVQKYSLEDKHNQFKRIKVSQQSQAYLESENLSKFRERQQSMLLQALSPQCIPEEENFQKVLEESFSMEQSQLQPYLSQPDSDLDREYSW